MFWIVQDNLHSENAYKDLLNALERSETPYQIVKVIPFIHTFEPDVNPEGSVFVVGATSLRTNSKTLNWIPGYFDQNLDYRLYMKHYGKHMLNHAAVVMEMKYITKVWDRFFIRPILDSKSFSGQAMTWDEFSEWRDKVHQIKEYDCASTLTTDDLIVMAPLRDDIQSEYRIFVVDGKIITSSMYKLGRRVTSHLPVPDHVHEFAQEMIDIWQPNRAFCLDVCEIQQYGNDRRGMKVMEINAINSSGFYNCDMYKFVDAINSMEF